MKKKHPFINKIIPPTRDVVGIDIGQAGTKIVRLKTDRDGNLMLAAADILPPIKLPESPVAQVEPLLLPKRLQAWSAGVSYSFPKAAVKLLMLPADKVDEASFSDLLGLPRTTEYRIAHRPLDDRDEGDIPVVGVGVSLRVMDWIQDLIPSGKPALGSIEISGLSTLSTYQYIYGNDDEQSCDLVIEAGERVTLMAICLKGVPVMLRQFEQGAASITEQVVKKLGVDEDTARDIIQIGAIDVSASVHSAFDEFLRQLGIAADFAERRSGSRIQRLFLSGGLAMNNDFKKELQNHVGIAPEIWNPWKGMTIMPNAISENARGNENVFHAATGVALGLLEV